MTRKLLALSVAATALSIGVANAQTTINGGGSTLAEPTYIQEYTQDSGVNFSYAGIGSGGGQNAFFENDIDYLLPQGSPSPNGYATGTLTYGTVAGSTVDFGASDAFLSAGGAFNLTTSGGYSASNSVDGTSASSAVDGPFIQIPTFGTGIDIVFTSPTYNAGTVSKPKYTALFTKLTLTDSQICGIFSGQLTDWGQVVTLTSKEEPAPINVVYRSDSSGTTFLLTNHFYDAGQGSVCNAGNDGSGGTGFTHLTAPTKVFTSLFTTVPGNFTGASGSQNVQSQILADGLPGSTGTTPGGIGYLSPDYSGLNKLSGSYNAKVLSAYVVNSTNGKAYQSTSTNTILALEHPAAESTNLAPPTGAVNAANPFLWVPSVPNATQGYPIIGYTTEEYSTCYADTAGVGTAVSTHLTDIFTNKNDVKIITNNGFAIIPAAFSTAIVDAFIKGVSPYAYHLNIDNKTVCANGVTGR
jgi:ABC-type phosphate transport system substrate-binding protein